MASHRKPRPAGARGAGLRTPALATAALTSVAVLSQTADAAPAASDDGRPSREEIEKKVDDLYRHAESATEKYAERQAEKYAEKYAGTYDAPKYNAARERDGRQRSSLDALREEVARRSGRLNKPRADQVSPAGASATVRRRLDATPAADSPATSQNDLRTAKSAVQHKLATARGMLIRLTEQGAVRPAAAERHGWQDTPDRPSKPTPQRTHWQDPGPAPTPQPDTTTPSGMSGPVESGGLPGVVESAGSPGVAAADGLPGSVQSASGGLPGVVESGGSLGPGGWAGSGGSRVTKAEKALAFARAQIGKPCVWGASGPGSYDCSGLTQAAWKAAGVALPRATRDQVHAGRTVTLAEARPGDLVFFHGDAGHVGLWLGDGMMIHAPKPGTYVREESVHHGGESMIHSVVRPA
ncbi:C40 family peptidase [Streptomyces sp. NPDC047028]|uniref:C40 family peptidase n=1 Tax=Streptomyces sp. NPDC047028 TaxID=3155793 RepID=UPI0033D97B45